MENESNIESYKKYTAVQLRSWLEKKKQKTTGTKAELILRLLSLPATQRGEFLQVETNSDDAHSDDSEAYADSISVVVEDMAARVIDSTRMNEQTERQQMNEHADAEGQQMNENAERQQMNAHTSKKVSTNDGNKESTNEGSTQNERQLESTTKERMQKMEKEIQQLKREIDLQAREKNVLMKEIELLKNYRQNTNSAGGVAVAVLKELLPEFRGECFSHWEKQFRNLIEAYNLDDNNARILISCRLGGNALKWFHSKSDLAQITTNQLMREMGEMFASNDSRLSLKRAFEGRVWQSTETFQSYVHEKTIMANRLDLDNDEVLESLIDGIPDIRLRTQARMQCFVTKQQLLEAFRQIELPKIAIKMSTSVSSIPRQSTAPIRTPSTSRAVMIPGQSTSQRAVTSGKIEAKQIRCYNCNSLGHYAYECRKERRQYGACHVCARLGHLASECPQRKALVLHTLEDDDEEDYERY